MNPPDWLTPTYRTWLDRESPRLIRVRHPNRQTRVVSWTDPDSELFYDWTLSEGFLTAQIWIPPPQPVLTARNTLLEVRQANASDPRSIVTRPGLFVMREIVNTGPVHSPDIIPPIVNVPPRNEHLATPSPDNNHSPDDSQVNESDIARSANALASSIQSLIDSMARQTIQYNDTSPGSILTPNSPDSSQQHAGAMTTSPDGLSPPMWHFIPRRHTRGPTSSAV